MNVWLVFMIVTPWRIVGTLMAASLVPAEMVSLEVVSVTPA